MAVDEQVMDGFEGSGIFESYASLVDATTNGAQNDAAEVGLAAAGAGLDTLGMVIDPLGTVLGAGVGWLLEHLSPFSEFLDLLAGDPDAVEATSTTLTGEADRIGGFAEAQGAAVAGLTQWSGESADGFRRRMDDLKQLIASLGEIVRGTGELVQMMGQAVAAVRGLIRDIIAEVIGGLIAGALVAAGLMPFTFGTSIAVFIGTAIGVVAGTVARIVKFVQKLTALVTRFAGRAGDLGRLSDEIAEIMARNSTDVPTPTPTPGDSPRSITPTPEANDVTAPPPASVAPPPNQSPTPEANNVTAPPPNTTPPPPNQSPTPDINNSGPTPTPNSGPTPNQQTPTPEVNGGGDMPRGMPGEWPESPPVSPPPSRPQTPTPDFDDPTRNMPGAYPESPPPSRPGTPTPDTTPDGPASTGSAGAAPSTAPPPPPPPPNAPTPPAAPNPGPSGGPSVAPPAPQPKPKPSPKELKQNQRAADQRRKEGGPYRTQEPWATVWDQAVTRNDQGLIDTIGGKPAAEFLGDLTKKRADELMEQRANGHYTKNELGPVNSLVLDRRTGEIYEGLNGDTSKNTITTPHPILQDRLDALEAGGPYDHRARINGDPPYSETGGHPHPHPDKPFGHAEVRAINELLHRRQEIFDQQAAGGSSPYPPVDRPTPETMGDFLVDNNFISGKESRPAPCCANCNFLLDGADKTPGGFDRWNEDLWK